jgi:hypothetical protein
MSKKFIAIEYVFVTGVNNSGDGNIEQEEYNSFSEIENEFNIDRKINVSSDILAFTDFTGALIIAEKTSNGKYVANDYIEADNISTEADTIKDIKDQFNISKDISNELFLDISGNPVLIVENF